MTSRVVYKIRAHEGASDMDIFWATYFLQGIINPEWGVTIDGFEEYLEAVGEGREIPSLSGVISIRRRAEKGLSDGE